MGFPTLEAAASVTGNINQFSDFTAVGLTKQYYNTIVSVLNGTTVESFSPATPLGPSNS